ncbi:MAG TPA: hypothetical protein PK794_06345, partial [Armatimonadota bacterium]|nr:hypothetical protein [Armatimonadota bacterium]
TTLERALVTVAQQSEDPVTKTRVYRLTLDTPINGAEAYESVRTHEQAVIVGTLDDPLTATQGDGKLYAFTEDLKANLWSFPTGGPIRTSPAISTEVGLVGERARSYTAYVGANDFFLYAVTFYGTFRVLRWEKSLRDRVYASPAVGMRTAEQEWARAIVYQPSRDKYMYAFGDQVGLPEDGQPQDPDGPDDNYIPPEDDDRDEARVPSTVMVQKSVEYKDGDTSWWKFVVTVRNIGRGKVENLKIYDILPAELSYPLVDQPGPDGVLGTADDIPGDPTAIPYTGPLNPDEKMHAPVNLGTPAQPQWEIMWTRGDDTGFTLDPDKGDPHQTTTEYKRTFVFYSRVRPSERTYDSMGVKMKVTTVPTVMANDTEVVTDAPAKVHMGDAAYVQITKHPVPAESGGNIGVNQVLARGITWAGLEEQEIAVRKETPVANDWTDTFIVRMYYNGFKGPDLRLAASGAELRAFSPWNYADHESGVPLAFQLPYTFKTNGMPVGARQMKTFVSPRAGDNYATSGVRLPLIPNVPQYNQTRFPGVPLSPTVMPYAWRLTIQQGRTQLNQKIGEWGPELPFMERIAVGTISGEVPAGGLSVRLKTTNLAKGLRVQAMKLRRLLFENPTEPDVEVYVVDITENPPVAPDVKDLTLTFARALPAKIEDGAILRDEWTADLAVLNPLAVSGLQGDEMNLGAEMRPGGTASAATLTVTNASRWDVPNPYSARYRIRVMPIDLRLPGNAFRWNDALEDPAVNAGYAFGAPPRAGAVWDGFRYDPYKEYHVTMTGAMLDLPDGSALRAGESLRMHVTRRLPPHQPNGGYGTFSEHKLTLLNDGARVFLDTNLDGVYQAGEDLLLEDLNANTLWDDGERLFVDVDGNGLPGHDEPVFALGAFDVRIFMDMNGNGVCDPGEPFYASAAATDAYTTADALPANPLRTTVGVAIQPALRVPSTMLDLGRQPAGALYGLPLRLPVIENPGNAPLTNVQLSTGNTLATSDNYATPLLNMLLRAGGAGVKPDLTFTPPDTVTVGKVSLRKVEEMQPLIL